MATTELAFRWTPELQAFRRDDEVYVHQGTTNTYPSHDVAHLILSASGSLEWLPRGGDRSVRLAEFNAVLLEHLCGTIADRKFARDAILDEALREAKWFVEEYYSPFPVPFDEALDRFRDGLDVEAVLRLSPIFFHQHAYERLTPTFREQTFAGAFKSDDVPDMTPDARRCVTELAVQLERLLVHVPA